ncbi:MAG: nucleotidyltransferase family protein [Gemmatimonadaceae bacterium]
MAIVFDAPGVLRAAIAQLLPGASRTFDHAQLSDTERRTLRAAAQAHGVLPLLAKVAGPLAEPELVAAARETALRSLAAVDTLRRAMSTLRTAGIPALAWKGPVLSQVAWGDLGSRAFHDLDIVVAPAQVQAAHAALREVGWTRRYAQSAAQEAAIFRGLGALDMSGPFEPPLLELHWEFSARRYAGRLPVAEVLARARMLSIAGDEILTPDAPDTLALLAQHGCKHAWGRLEDLAVFSAVAVSDIDAVVEAHRRAMSVGGARAVRLAVALGARLLGVDRPKALAAACERDAALAPLVREVEERWARGETDAPTPLRWDLQWTDGTVHRLRLLARSAFDPTLREWEALRLPDALVGLYPVFRPIRRLWSALGGAPAGRAAD